MKKTDVAKNAALKLTLPSTAFVIGAAEECPMALSADKKLIQHSANQGQEQLLRPWAL
jgi:hypothetical protein